MRTTIEGIAAVLCLVVLFGAAEAQPEQEEYGVLKNIKPAQIDSLVKSYQGDRAVLVNIWATWCGPCVEEFPHIVKLQKQYEDQLRVVFISADMSKDRQRVVDFLKEHKVGWTTYFKRGDDQQFIRTIDKEWGGALPFTKIYGVDGSVVASWHDKADYAKLHKYVKQALKTES